MTDEERRLFEECRWLRIALVRESNAAALAQSQLTIVQERSTALAAANPEPPKSQPS